MCRGKNEKMETRIRRSLKHFSDWFIIYKGKKVQITYKNNREIDRFGMLVKSKLKRKKFHPKERLETNRYGNQNKQKRPCQAAPNSIKLFVRKFTT